MHCLLLNWKCLEAAPWRLISVTVIRKFLGMFSKYCTYKLCNIKFGIHCTCRSRLQDSHTYNGSVKLHLVTSAYCTIHIYPSSKKHGIFKQVPYKLLNINKVLKIACNIQLILHNNHQSYLTASVPSTIYISTIKISFVSVLLMV